MKSFKLCCKGNGNFIFGTNEVAQLFAVNADSNPGNVVVSGVIVLECIPIAELSTCVRVVVPSDFEDSVDIRRAFRIHDIDNVAIRVHKSSRPFENSCPSISQLINTVEHTVPGMPVAVAFRPPCHH